MDPLATRAVVGSLVALCTVAVAQPLLDLVGRNAAFLVAHDATSGDVIVLALGLTAALPLALAAVVLAARRVHRGVALAVQTALVALFAGVLMLVVLRRSAGGLSAPVALFAAGAAATGGALLYRRSGVARAVLTWLAVTAPVVAALFVLATPASTLVFADAAEASVSGLGDDAPPVVLVIFDELPLASLLDDGGGIDGAAFPAFARFAADATFFRNATGVAGQTSDAIPAALTGRYARLDALPVAADHPDNLFSLLGDAYALHAVEPLTDLCPAGRCRRTIPLDERYAALVRDLGVVAAHAVVPPALSETLPPVDQGWRDFRGQAAALGKEVAVRDRFRAARAGDPVGEFERFVDEIRAAQRPTLHFMHSLLPHRPWSYLADGRSYAMTREAAGMELGRWLDDPEPVWHSYQRHLVQTQLADRLLGDLLDALEREGVYDESLVIVMADHGISFTPGTSLRVLEQATFGEIAAVPLLVKTPGQEAGDVSDRPVETIDVLPTILDVLGTQPPGDVDGVSVLDGGPPRTTKRFDSTGGPLTFPADGTEKWAAVERKVALFDHDGPFPYPYNLAPGGTAALLGQPVAAEVRPAPDLAVRLNAPEAGVQAPTALVSGVIDAPAGVATPAAVAVAVDGAIRAVTRPDADGAFRVFLPPEALPASVADASVLSVGADGRLAVIRHTDP